MSWFGRSALIGLGVSVTISTGLIALLIIKEALRRRNRRRLLLHNTSSGLQNDAGMDQKHHAHHHSKHKYDLAQKTRGYGTNDELLCLCLFSGLRGFFCSSEGFVSWAACGTEEDSGWGDEERVQSEEWDRRAAWGSEGHHHHHRWRCEVGDQCFFSSDLLCHPTWHLSPHLTWVSLLPHLTHFLSYLFIFTHLIWVSQISVSIWVSVVSSHTISCLIWVFIVSSDYLSFLSLFCLIWLSLLSSESPSCLIWFSCFI